MGRLAEAARGLGGGHAAYKPGDAACAPLARAQRSATTPRDDRDQDDDQRELEIHRQVSLLAIGLVLATTLVVAVVAHEALGFGWAEAFVLGPVVSPTDPVAATAIARRLGVPGRIVTIVEGESLVNDGSRATRCGRSSASY